MFVEREYNSRNVNAALGLFIQHLRKSADQSSFVCITNIYLTTLFILICNLSNLKCVLNDSQ
jgi:hypothetical protein